MSGWTFLGIVAAICVGAFLIGVRFSRLPEEKARGMQVEMPGWLARGRSPAAQVHLLGRVLMIAAPIMLLFFAALSFGLIGTVEGVTTIQFPSE